MNFLSRIISKVPQGTAPLGVDSTTVVPSFNSDLVEGQHGSYYAIASTSPIVTIGGSTPSGKTGDIWFVV
jgi:hypothetical protein